MTVEIINNTISDILWSISDPEIPVLSIMDMGIVRDCDIEGKTVKIKLTPTYSGCPAMDTIKDDIAKALHEAGYKAEIDFVLAPAWTTDWITDAGKNKLEAYGIAPPVDPVADKKALLHKSKEIKCPRCGDLDTQMISQFGSTACKALFKCNNCLEPFDYFKCL